jgi:hypothetical protein
MISETGLARQVRPYAQRSWGVHVLSRKNKNKLYHRRRQSFPVYRVLSQWKGYFS